MTISSNVCLPETDGTAMTALYMPINHISKDSFTGVSNIYEVPTMCQ